MNIFIDFSSYGDAAFYLNYWKKGYEISGVKTFFIYHMNGLSISKKNLGIPLLFLNKRWKFLHFGYKFLIQSLVILSIITYTRLSRNKINVIINLHQPFKFWNWLFRFSNKKNTTRIVIVHDIVAFDTTNYPRSIISSNEIILNNADVIILHNGIEMFKSIYGDDMKVEILPFPLRKPYAKSQALIESKYYYVPGRYRKEKGFDFVIGNWPEDEDRVLVISTELPEHLVRIVKNVNNIIYNPNWGGSEEFQNLIANSYSCILMYESGTNSGVLTTIITNNVRCLVSDIPMFRDHPSAEALLISKLNRVDFLNSLKSLDTFEEPKYLNNDVQKSLRKYILFIKSTSC